MWSQELIVDTESAHRAPLIHGSIGLTGCSVFLRHAACGSSGGLRLLHLSARWGQLAHSFITHSNVPHAPVGQGTLRKWTSRKGSGLIRDFSGLWQQLLNSEAADINITVLGKGRRRDLDIPPALDSRVAFYSGLPYPVRIHL